MSEQESLRADEDPAEQVDDEAIPAERNTLLGVPEDETGVRLPD